MKTRLLRGLATRKGFATALRQSSTGTTRAAPCGEKATNPQRWIGFALGFTRVEARQSLASTPRQPGKKWFFTF
jgi:hypothetical protein